MVRVGTLDQAENVPPDLHIYARSKLPWVVLGEEVPSVDGWYDREKVWPKESLERLRVCRERAEKGD